MCWFCWLNPSAENVGILKYDRDSSVEYQLTGEQKCQDIIADWHPVLIVSSILQIILKHN